MMKPDNKTGQPGGSAQRKAVFLDRDGVIIVERNYICRAEDLEFIPRSIDGMKALVESGFELAIVTNQAGIGRGYFTEEDYHTFTDRMLSTLSMHGVRVGSVQFCPHHPTAGIGVYKTDCVCRKPKNGMLTKAAAELGVELKGAWLVGDKTTDIKAGIISGCSTILVKTGYGGSDKEVSAPPDYAADDLNAAAAIILGCAKKGTVFFP
ncbi:MAG: HAD family hydrolase [Geobacter sp.]|nr:HAD family hydrolase [Geobacter sp.]